MADLIADDVASWTWPPDVKARMDAQGKLTPPAPPPEPEPVVQLPCDTELDEEMMQLLGSAHC